MAETWTSFVAECFWVGVKDHHLSALDQRVHACVAGMALDGESVSYLGSVLMREDEVVLCFFEGTATNVRRAAVRAGVPFERIVETTRSSSSMRITDT